MLPRPWACKRPPEMDTGCEDFQASLYCFLFHPLKYDCAFLCLFCACFVRVFVLFIDYTREETHADCQRSSILIGAGPSDT